MAFEFPFEREAMNNSIPPALSLLDTGACLRLCEIYLRYHAAPPEWRAAAREQAKKEKDKLRQEWEYRTKLAEHRARVLNETDYMRMECKKNPTPENVTRLLDIIDGIRGRAI